MVLINRHMQTAIVLDSAQGLVRCVRMRDGQLRTEQLPQSLLDEEGFRPLLVKQPDFSNIEYPVLKAAALYLKHPGGLEPSTRKELQGLIDFFG